MKADSVKSIQNRLPEIVQEVDRSSELFKDLYRFTFKFGLDTAAGQRILPTDMAVLLWQLVFSRMEPPILKRWLEFLETHQNVVRGIPRDTWNMFLNFSETIGEELSSYDDTEAWPSLFDDFVEYENDKMNQNIAKDDKELGGIHREELNLNDWTFNVTLLLIVLVSLLMGVLWFGVFLWSQKVEEIKFSVSLSTIQFLILCII